jgi:hypothetical protein
MPNNTAFAGGHQYNIRNCRLLTGTFFRLLIILPTLVGIGCQSTQSAKTDGASQCGTTPQELSTIPICPVASCDLCENQTKFNCQSVCNTGKCLSCENQAWKSVSVDCEKYCVKEDAFLLLDSRDLISSCTLSDCRIGPTAGTACCFTEKQPGYPICCHGTTYGVVTYACNLSKTQCLTFCDSCLPSGWKGYKNDSAIKRE